MKTENVKLTKNNYYALMIFWSILFFGFLGGTANQNWADNIYTFMSFIIMIIFALSAIGGKSHAHHKEFISTYFINVLFCVAMGWWWLCLCWLIITCSAGFRSRHYKSIKEAVEDENK